MRFCFFVALVACLGNHAEARKRGYSLSFQGMNAVAGIRNGVFNFSDPGLDVLSTNFTVSYWAKYDVGKYFGYTFMSGSQRDHLNRVTYLFSGRHFGMAFPFYYCQWMLPRSNAEFRYHAWENWHYYSMVWEEGNMRLYVNGILETECIYAAWGAYTFQRPGATLHLGSLSASVQSPQNNYVRSEGQSFYGHYVGFMGKLDEFALFNKALTKNEINDYMVNSVDTSNMPDELPIYYDMEVTGCDPGAAALSLYADSCGITGSGYVKNHGRAGDKYDLVLGALNDVDLKARSWIMMGDTGKNPETYAFTKPVACLSSAPEFSQNTTGDDHKVPTILHVLDNSSVVVEFPRGYTPVKVETLPGNGNLTTFADNATNLAVDADISSATKLVYHASERFLPLMFKIRVKDGSNVEVSHEVHIWSYLTPFILADGEDISRNKYTVTMLEKGQRQTQLRMYGLSWHGEDLDIEFTNIPEFVNVSNVIWVESQEQGATFVQAPIEDNVIKNHHGLTINLRPHFTFSGTQYLKLRYVSPTSGKKSDELTVVIKVLENDNLPEIEDGLNETTPNLVNEDNSSGILIDIKGKDEEEIHGLILTIDELPTKGKLFKQVPGETDWWDSTEWQEIDKKFNLYDVGSPIIQYAKSITKASSFRTDLNIDFNFHVENILGAPDCIQNGYSDCEFTPPSEFLSTLEMGSIVRANVYHNNSNMVHLAFSDDTRLSDNYLAAKIIERFGEGVDANYTVQVMPTWTYVEEDGEKILVRCMIHRGPENKNELSYPEDCHVKDDKGNPIIPSSDFNITITNVGLGRGIIYHGRRFWEPARYLSSNMDEMNYTHTDDKSVFYGAKYNTSHNVAEHYLGLSEPRYTEYIEFEIGEEVYPVAVDVGSSHRAGGVVAVKVMTPDDKWVYLVRGDPEKEKAKKKQTIKAYFHFKPSICQQNFKSKRYRIEIDASAESGVYAATVDYVKVIGSPEVQPAVLAYNYSEGTKMRLDSLVKYVPNPDSFGMDQFKFSAHDCGGDFQRKSKEQGTHFINITETPDAPVVVIPANKPLLKCNSSDITGGPVAFDISVTASDVDKDELVFELVLDAGYSVVDSSGNSGAAGMLMQNSKQLTVGSILEANKVESGLYTSDLQILIDNCYKPSIRTGAAEFMIKVYDKDGINYTNRPIQFKILKEDKHLASTSKTFATVFIVLNLGLSAFMMVWVFVYRKHPIVKASQVEFLGLILVGTVLSSSTILTLMQDDGIDGSGAATADMACALMPWLYTFGFMTTFAPLYLKLFKVSKLFDINTRSTGKKFNKLSVKRLLLRVLFLWGIDFIICILFTFAPGHRMTYVRDPLRYDTDDINFAVESAGNCYSEYAFIYVIIIAAFHIVMLTHVAYYCYKTRAINDAFSEGKYLRIAIGSSLQVLLFSLPIMIMMAENPDPDTNLFIRAGIIWLNDFTVLGFIFAPKIYFTYFGVNESGIGAAQITTAVSKAQSTVSKISPDLNSSTNSTANNTSVLATSKGTDSSWG